MKRITSILVAFAILCGMWVIPVNAEGNKWDKYIGTYYIPESWSSPWFGSKLAIMEINDNYVDYDFSYINMGHAAAFEEDRAYFKNEYIAEGKGRSGYADSTERQNIENRLTFYDNHIRFNTTGLRGNEKDFYLNVSGKFTNSKLKNQGYEEDVFYLICDDKYIDVSDKTLRIIDTETYDTVFTENNVAWNFISDGSTLYYHDWKSLKKIDLNTLDTESVFDGMHMIFIEDIFENRYVLYGDSAEQYASESNSYVYDMYTGVRYLISEYSTDGGFTKTGRVVTMDLTGEVSPIDLMISDIDGKNQKIITDMMMAYSYYIGDEYIYYAELLTNSYEDMCFVVKKCDFEGNEIAVLTNEIHNAVDVEVTDSYVEYVDISDGNYYKNKPKTYISYDRKNINNSIVNVELNGSKIHFDQTPILYNECTLVPMRAIFEVLGAEVTWDGNTQTVTAKRDNKTVKITIGDSFFYINGRKTKLEAPAMLVNDTTLVPVRAVSEAFNCRVDWDGENKTVLIKSNVAAKNSKMIEKLFEYDDTIKNEGNFDKTVIINDSVYHIKSEQIYNGDPEDIFKIEINGTAVNNNAYFGITDAYLVDLNPTDGCVELLISTFGDSAIIDLKAFQFDNGEIRTLKFVNSYNWFNENTSYLYVGSNYNGIEMNDDNSITLTTRTNSWGMWGVRTTFRLNENNEIEQEIQDKYDVDLDEFMDNDIMANHGNSYSREEYNMYRKHYALCKKSYGVLNKGDYFTILYDDNCGNIFVKTLSGKSGWINIRSVPYNERESISKLMFYLAS